MRCTRYGSIREWRVRYQAGEFDAPDVGVQIGAGWFDWFCPDEELAAKLPKLAEVLLAVRDGGKVDLDACGVIFKNNCPMVGDLYDDFRIVDADGDVVFCCSVDEPNERYGDGLRWHAHAMDKHYARAYDDAYGFESAEALAEWLSEPWEDDGMSVIDGWFEIHSDVAVTEEQVVENLEKIVTEDHGPVLLDPVVEFRGVQTRQMAMFYMKNTLNYLLPADGRMNSVVFPFDGGALVCYATEAIPPNE